jgi:site-specific DNA-methyltransferase (adenine-specific)
MMGKNELIHGDCLEVMRGMGAASVDAVVTDPPYGLSFMGKKWDYDVPSEDVWRECLRVLKPGGHLLAFAGTRTQHRMAVRIEDAGFEIRDMIAWVYGSGFPKSHNLKDEWQGWGTALKPALEPITVARKPLGEKTVAANVLEYGTGAINVDGCRVGTDGENFDHLKGRPLMKINNRRTDEESLNGAAQQAALAKLKELGRWPANLIHDGSDEVVAGFPDCKTGGGGITKENHRSVTMSKASHKERQTIGYADSGSAARFFYCAKASKRDRDEGCEGMEGRKSGMSNGAQLNGEGYDKGQDIGLNRVISRSNHHPTVKPTDLMRYLCRLVTPPNGIVLDPFMGSGSTGKAAVLEGFEFIGIEREAEYVEIAKARINAARVLL